jgi:gamma-glutamyltranspeptidase/glutathione hydrolase
MAASPSHCRRLDGLRVHLAAGVTLPTYMDAMRPALRCKEYAVSAGHYLAATAAHNILAAGGNAVDAGVAGGLVLGVVMPEFVHVGGVAPIILRLADGTVVTLPGLGRWPELATLETCKATWGPDCTSVPTGIGRQIVPGAPAAWIRALELYGTKSWSEVAATAVSCAEGIIVYPILAHNLAPGGYGAEAYKQGEETARVMKPDGRAPELGEMFIQENLAKTLKVRENHVDGGVSSVFLLCPEPVLANDCLFK